MQNKVPIVIFILLFCMSAFSILFMLDQSKENKSYVWNTVTEAGKQPRNVSAETIISTVEDNDETAGDANTFASAAPGTPATPGASAPPSVPGVAPAPAPSVDTSSWLAICKSVHNAFGGAGFHYVLGGTGSLTYDGNTDRVRKDCSGYVGYCMYKYGIANSPTPITSGSDLTAFGCTEVSKDQMQGGDIIEYSGHIEVLSSYENGQLKVYNWGGHKSAEDRYAGVADPTTVVPIGNSGKTYDAILKVYRVPAR